MLRLFCRIVGDEEGGLFSVQVDESVLGEDLIKAIKEKKSNKITCDADGLRLFLAKTADGAWLTEDQAEEAVKLDTQGHLQGFEEMDPTLQISDEKHFGVNFRPRGGQVHVLVVVLKGAGGDQELERKLLHDALTRIPEENLQLWHKAAAEIRERDRKFAEELRERDRKHAELTRQLIKRAIQPATPSRSDSELGLERLNLLRNAGCVSDAEETVGADAFWSVEVQAQVDCIKTEDALVAFITPYFSNALDSHAVVFVNSARYNWLPQTFTYGYSKTSTALKPSGFVTHRGMYHKEPEPNDDATRVGASFRFGTAVKPLFDCLVLFESSIMTHLGGAPFGQVVRYMQYVFPKGPGSAVLFNNTTFWLIHSIDGVVVRVVRAKWVMEGSKALFLDFITKNLSPWVTRLTAACSALNVEVVEGDAFLGRGAFGRVFKVKRVGQDGEELALKVVESSSVGRLFQEQDALVRVQHTGLAIRRVGAATEISDGAAMLLSPVGEPISYPTARQEARALFDMLWQLHAAGLVHGDPRVPNVIVKDGNRLWIDLVEWRDASPLLMQNDAKMLTQSVLHGFLNDSLDLELEVLINDYGASPTQTNLALLADKVGEKFAAS